jgi:hypothetical protein
MTVDPDFEILNSAISRGEHLLVVEGEQIFLAKERFKFLVDSEPSFAAAIVADLAAVLDRFDRLTPIATSYSITQVPLNAGVIPKVANKWDSKGIVTPSVVDPDRHGIERRFSRFDINLAALARGLRRRGAALDVMARVALALRGRDKTLNAHGPLEASGA